MDSILIYYRFPGDSIDRWQVASYKCGGQNSAASCIGILVKKGASICEVRTHMVDREDPLGILDALDCDAVRATLQNLNVEWTRADEATLERVLALVERMPRLREFHYGRNYRGDVQVSARTAARLAAMAACRPGMSMSVAGVWSATKPVRPRASHGIPVGPYVVLPFDITRGDNGVVNGAMAYPALTRVDYLLSFGR